MSGNEATRGGQESQKKTENETAKERQKLMELTATVEGERRQNQGK